MGGTMPAILGVFKLQAAAPVDPIIPILQYFPDVYSGDSALVGSVIPGKDLHDRS
jgi:hypothetical protein